MIRKSRLIAAVGTISLVTGLTACGSSGSSANSQQGASSSSASVRGVTDNQIIIGGVASLTSPQGPVFPGADIGAQAAFERANREGGINGRKIKFIFLDDGSSATTNLADVQKLVLQDNAFALAPVTSEVFLPDGSNFLKSHNVPFTGWGFQPGFCANSYGFGFNGCLVGTSTVNSAILGPLTKVLKKGAAIAIEADDSSSGQSAVKQAQVAAKYYGFKLVYGQAELPLDHPVTDFTPYTTKIMTSHPDLILTDSGNFANDVGLDGALKAGGYGGPTMNFVTYVPGLLTSSASVAKAIDGAYMNIQFAPQEQGGAAVTQVENDLKAIGQKPFVTIGVATSYWSAELMIDMLKAAGKNLTPQGLISKVNAGWTWNPSPSGGVGPVSFPQGHNQAAPCAALVQATGTTYKSVVPMTCYKVLPAGS